MKPDTSLVNKTGHLDLLTPGADRGGADRGEHRSITHAPDTEREPHVPGVEGFVERSKREEAGTVQRPVPGRGVHLVANREVTFSLRHILKMVFLPTVLTAADSRTGS